MRCVYYRGSQAGPELATICPSFARRHYNLKRLFFKALTVSVSLINKWHNIVPQHLWPAYL